jgi:hypothetical protein
MHRARRIKAQSFSEYSILIVIALIAIIAMNVYVKRGLQGRYADMADIPAGYIKAKVGSVLEDSGYVIPSQYEPYYEESTSNISMPLRTVEETFRSDGFMNKVLPAASSSTVKSVSIEGTDVD